MRMRIKHRKLKLFGVVMLTVLGIAFYFSLPDPLFSDPTSTVLEDRNGLLLGAMIAEDGQWRFPSSQNIPENYKTAVLEFEDRYFYKHPGVNLFSLLRAIKQNIKNGEIVSGGSTLTMQTIRLSRKGKPRTIREKLIEIAMALRLELSLSKSEIFVLYASHAPFGGNVVGLEAASWRYFGRPAHDLSWAEAATLAVLPNAPSLIHPGRNQESLLKKRNLLLNRLNEKSFIDDITLELALEEPLPGKPLPLGQSAPHLLARVYQDSRGEKQKTTLDYFLQKNVTEVVQKHHNVLKHNEVYNAAALVVKVGSGEVLAYIGNTNAHSKADHGCDVDIIPARRSTGSILKPLLYAAMLDEGLILPKTLIHDVPTNYGSFTPMNFDRKYAGVVPADKALYRSLNVPAVKMLQSYGVPAFHDLLKNIGMTTLNRSSDHYGLSLILGGAETTMWDLASIYGSFSRTLTNFYDNSSQYDEADWHPPYYLYDTGKVIEPTVNLKKHYNLGASSIWFAYEAMRQVNRPEELTGWEVFSSSQKIAWKTGTSFGFRDAWAVGTSKEYVVVVWVGNADGEGRPGLTGVQCAAPILFDVFNLLPESDWFDPPYDELTEAAICKNSGHRAGMYCTEIDTMYVPQAGINVESCPYHELVHLDSTGTYRVDGQCYDPASMIHTGWFVLPPVMEWYYKQSNPYYKSLPVFSPECMATLSSPMEFIYPRERSRFFIPVNLDRSEESIVFEIAHHDESATIYWHMNEKYLGTTKRNHQIAIHPEAGKYLITAVDNGGNSISRQIEILSN